MGVTDEVCTVQAFIAATEYQCCGEPLRVGDVTTVLQTAYRGGHLWDDLAGPIDWRLVRHPAADPVVTERVRVWRVLEVRTRQSAEHRDEPRVVLQESGRTTATAAPGAGIEGWILQLELLAVPDADIDPGYSVDAVRRRGRPRATSASRPGHTPSTM